MKYRFLTLALILPLGAATCQDQLRSTLTQTCDGLDVVYAHYDAVAQVGVVPAVNMKWVETARQQTDRVCASPGTATTVSVTAAAAQAYLALNAAFKASKSKVDSRLGYTKLQDLKRLLEQARRN